MHPAEYVSPTRDQPQPCVGEGPDTSGRRYYHTRQCRSVMMTALVASSSFRKVDVSLRDIDLDQPQLHSITDVEGALASHDPALCRRMRQPRERPMLVHASHDGIEVLA